MKRFLVIFIILTGLCFSQNVQVISNQTILKNDNQHFAFPKFNPQGDKILVSSPKYRGLWLYEIQEKKLQNLNTKNGSGYKAQFSEDGKQILFRYNTYQNHRKYSTLAIQNVEDNQIETLVKNKRKLSPPHYFEKKSIMYNLQGSKQVFDLSSNTAKEISALSKAVISEPLAYTENSNLIIQTNGKEKILNPAGEGHYIWGSISPQKDRILFTLAGQGTFICDLEGNIIADLGHANYPSWSPDGKWIVAMQDEDDGHKITASEIVVKSANGEQEFLLTKSSDKIEMHPDWSPAGDKIVYDTISGNIEVLQLEIQE